MYAAETWTFETLRKEEMRRINALEIRLWRRMEEISWTEKRTDEEVLKLIGEKRRMGEVIVRKQKNWIGYIIRHDGLLKQVIKSRMEGKRVRGRPKMGMLHELMERSYLDMKRRAEDREGWRCWVPGTCR